MTFCSYSGQGTCQDLRRGTEDAGCVDGSHLRAPSDQGEQGHLPPGGVRGKVHVSLPQVRRGDHGRFLIQQVFSTIP